LTANNPTDEFQLTIEQPQDLTVYQWTPVGGARLDTLVRIRNSDGRVIASNDDNNNAVMQAYREGTLSVEPAGAYNSAVTVGYVPRGTYTVVADKYNGTGDYRLVVVAEQPPDPTPQPTPGPTPGVNRIQLFQEVSGHITANNPTDEFELTTEQPYNLTIYEWTPAGGARLDTLVRIKDSDGRVIASNDDNNDAVFQAYREGRLSVEPAGGYNSAVVVAVPAGTYTIVADKYDGTGDYRLVVVVN